MAGGLGLRIRPAGPIQADVYFNTNYRQPAGDVSGTVTFTYNPQ